MPRTRLDQLLVARKLATSRSRALGLVMAGEVFVDGQRIDKPGALVPQSAVVEVRSATPTYVSRGGTKLAGALDAFRVDVAGLSCLDVGASTGGFTDCLLQRGAAHVVAVDVGSGQLAYKLRLDPRVTLMERTNARDLTAAAIGGASDITVVDAAFIGLDKLMSAIANCTRSGGALVALIKPQFEVGREQASRDRGVIRDDAVRAEAVARATQAVKASGFEIKALEESVLTGPKGNREVFLHAMRL